MTLTRSMMILTAAATLLPFAAQAEQKPTIVVMHRNIQNQKDESNWRNLANGLANDGYRVVSVALKPAETAAEGRDHVMVLLNESPEYGKVVLVGTAAASDAVSLTAEAAQARVQAVVYVSAEAAVPTLGPRTVNVPSNLVGKVTSYQIKISNGKRPQGFLEPGASMIRVREEGHSTLAKVSDLVDALEMVATDKRAKLA